MQHVLRALEKHGGNKAAAAAELGISLKTTYNKTESDAGGKEDGGRISGQSSRGKSIMRPDELVELLNRRPFVPIRLHLSDGKTYEVKHPDMVIVGRSYMHIGVPRREGSKVADRILYCSLLHIVRVEELKSEASPTS